MLTAATSPRCSGDLIFQSLRNGKAYHLQSVCSKTVQEIFQELGEECRDQRHASMAIITGADRVLPLNEETKDMSFHDAHQSYLKFDIAQQGHYKLILLPKAELAPEQFETTEKKPTEPDLMLPQTNSSDSQSSLSLFGRFKKITLDFLYAIPVYLKKVIDYIKNLFKSSTVKPTQPTQVRFGEARVREFDKKGSPSDIGEIHSRTFERFEN